MAAGAFPDQDRLASWRRLRVGADTKLRADLIESYLPFARLVAATYYGKRIDDDIAFDDYLQWALVGMIESLDRFDPSLGIKFETFASPRMRGAIFDGIESATEKQRQIAARRRLRSARVDDVKAAASTRAGGKPVGADELLGWLAEVGMAFAVTLMLEDTAMIETSPAAPALGHFGYERTHLRQVRTALHASVDRLSDQEQVVIRSHYLQDWSFDEIGKHLQLTKGRISQIHRQALGKLRGLLGEGRAQDLLL